MRKGRILFSLLVIALGAFAVYKAYGWTFKAKLFPLSVAIPLIALAFTQLLLDLFGKAESASGPAVELDFAADVPHDVARGRVIGIFLWIAGFIVLVLLVGFPVAVPLFIFSYLSAQSRVGWKLAVSLTAIAWALFYGLFQWLLHLPFEAGLIQSWLGL